MLFRLEKVAFLIKVFFFYKNYKLLMAPLNYILHWSSLY